MADHGQMDKGKNNAISLKGAKYELLKCSQIFVKQ